MEIDTIVKALKIICSENELKPSADMILDCAVRIHITKMIGKAKNGEDGATDKQKETLKKFNIEFKPEISKKDASKLISDKINSFS